MASVIEGDVIPRLVLAHRRAAVAAGGVVAAGRPHGQRDPRCDLDGRSGALGGNAGGPGGGPVNRPGDGMTAFEAARPDADVETFAHLILSNDMDRAVALLDDRRARGATFEGLCASVLGPTARLLEAYWSGDACDFTDLTVGLGRLQRLLHDLDHEVAPERALCDLNHRVLVSAVPGEQHTFGVSMLSALFQRAGWHVTDALVVESFEDLVAQVRDDPFPLIGLWVGGPCRLPGVATGIDALRRASAHPEARILVAGPPCAAPASDGAALGADALAETAPEAVARAECLLGRPVEPN
ncbi:methanogenic corrinoid protein MtbC1 [Roseospira goensis]|uniref:Methanogenic corrinoid protein MtbC1 n=1 Tax=Roseospira goensis TaxID=391922 RepID=A0A7W6WIL8_9PROT|nr:cobalamin B12-binding domain-containing protein [Roseospira goensis]MBB4284371.1 methanogenic corrinoid protein MtbC1 [Roseospira goensis]